MRLVVFGYGNPSRGDDALGPLLLHRLEQLAVPHVLCIEDFQLQIEHALDLDGADLALFLDAGSGTAAPYSFCSLTPGGGPEHSSHALTPEAVLDVYCRIRPLPPPPSFLLCLRGESFGLGEPLSAAAAAHLEAGWQFLQQQLLPCTEATQWQRLCQPPGIGPQS